MKFIYYLKRYTRCHIPLTHQHVFLRSTRTQGFSMWCHTSCKIDKKKKFYLKMEKWSHILPYHHLHCFTYFWASRRKRATRNHDYRRVCCRSIKHNLHITSYKLNIFHMHIRKNLNFPFRFLRIWIFFFIWILFEFISYCLYWVMVDCNGLM